MLLSSCGCGSMRRRRESTTCSWTLRSRCVSESSTSSSLTCTPPQVTLPHPHSANRCLPPSLSPAPVIHSHGSCQPGSKHCGRSTGTLHHHCMHALDGSCDRSCDICAPPGLSERVRSGPAQLVGRRVRREATVCVCVHMRTCVCLSVCLCRHGV